jgi:MFS transporter, OFA family, oxalate/formate antiporter
LVTIANLQYGWTLFINPIDEKYHWGRAAIQVTFTILIVTETWVAPIAGYLIDRFGPRVIVCGSGALVAIAWIIKSFADSLLLFYLAAVIAGLGAGPIFAATVGNALKWFPDRRGLATGLTAAGFGAGSALTVVPLAAVIQSSGYEAAYLWFGLGQGLVVMLVALLLRAPQHADVVTPSSAKVPQSKYDYAPAEVLKSLPFWLMYAMFVMVGTSGLMVTAQLAPVAADFAIDNVPVSILGLTMSALSFALSVGLVLNGLSRPFFGWVSDRIGREHTMFIAFLLEGLGIYALILSVRYCSCCFQDWYTSPGARFLRCSRQPAPTSTAGNSQPRITACSIRPREWPLCWCRWPTCLLPQPEAGPRSLRWHRRSASSRPHWPCSH